MPPPFGCGEARTLTAILDQTLASVKRHCPQGVRDAVSDGKCRKKTAGKTRLSPYLKYDRAFCIGSRFTLACGRALFACALSAPHNMLCRAAHSPVSRTPHDSQNCAEVFVTGAPQLGQNFGILSALSSRIRFTASVAGIVAAR